MKVSILTMFHGLSQLYSLVNVVAEQVQMLLDHDYEVSLIVSEDCKKSERFGIFLDERIKWVRIPHTRNGMQIELHDYSNPEAPLHESFYQEAALFAEFFVQALEDSDVCIMHDILYQGHLYVYNIGIRLAQKHLPNLRFLACSHSFPANRPINPSENSAGRYTPMENTLFIYPSYSGISALAKQYQVPEGLCRVIYTTVPLVSSCCDDVKKLHAKVNLLDTELLIVYPGRLTTGKKFEKVAALAGTLKRVGEKTTKVIFCDFPSADVPPEEYRDAIRYVGDFYGLAQEDMVFTSEQGWTDGFSRQGVMDLFRLSNLYICPSMSEAFSLTTLEAASNGNFLILNQSVPALEEAGTALGAYFLQWDARHYGYNKRQQYTPSERAYYEKHAPVILQKMREESVCNAKTIMRTRFNQEWVWNNQLEPLLKGC